MPDCEACLLLSGTKNGVLTLRHSFGSFKGWLDAHHPSAPQEWTKLFRSTFVFTGGEIVCEFLVSTGYLKGAHDQNCPTYKKVALLKPAWTIIK